MSISFSGYNPMCLDVRHYLFLIPVLAIPASFFLYDFITETRNGILLILIIGMTLIASAVFDETNHIMSFALLFVLFLLKYVKADFFGFKPAFTILFILILLMAPAEMAIHAAKVKYSRQRDFLQQKILTAYDGRVIVTDDIQTRLGDYYNGFSESGPLFRSYYNMDDEDIREGQFFLLHNPYTSHISNAEIPFYARYTMAVGEVIETDKATGMALYKIPVIPAVRILVESKNDFEEDHKYWSKTVVSGETENVYRGKGGNTFGEYSATFEYDFDSLYNIETGSLLVQTEFMCRYSANTAPQLVFILQKEGKEYFRETVLFNPFIKSISAWWPVETEIFIPSSKIRSGSKLLIYIWNPQNISVSIDDLIIKVAELQE